MATGIDPESKLQLEKNILSMVSTVRHRCWRQRFANRIYVMLSWSLGILIFVSIFLILNSDFDCRLFQKECYCCGCYFIILSIFRAIVWWGLFVGILLLTPLSFPWIVGGIKSYPRNFKNEDFAKEIDTANNLDNTISSALKSLHDSNASLTQDQLDSANDLIASPESRRKLCQNTYTERHLKYKKLALVLGIIAIFLSIILPFLANELRIIPLPDFHNDPYFQKCDQFKSLVPPQTDDEKLDSDNNCEAAPSVWLKPVMKYDYLTLFGHRHEIQGDLSQVKFSDLEPALPYGDLKVAPGNDVVKKIESYFNVLCTQDNPIKKVADGTTVQLIFCSKSERTRDYQDDDYSGTVPVGFYPRQNEETDICHHQVADFAYLSLVSPIDKYAKVYQIGTEVDFGFVDGIEDMCRYTLNESGSLTLVDVVSEPFMDTKGLYIRTKYFHENIVEHDDQDSSTEWKINYTTWLFAGDKLRLVKSWEDSSYKYYHEENYDDICTAYQQSEEYNENYMYYESGDFKLVQKSAHNKAELGKLISSRP